MRLGELRESRNFAGAGALGDEGASAQGARVLAMDGAVRAQEIIMRA